MRRSYALVIVLLLATGVASAQSTPADWPDPTSLTFEPIEFTPITPTRLTLSNGITVYLSENHTLPLVDGVAYVDAKGVFDPADKIGLAAFTTNLLREGGAGGRSVEEIDARLEFLAASVEAGANDFYSSVSFSALSENVDEVLELWRDVLVDPQFDADRVEIERQRQLEAIRRVVDNPVQLGAREFFFRVAEGHPSGAYPTEATISAIARDDLLAFHGRFFQPQATIVALTGDFDTDEMIARLEAVFGDWQGEAVDYPDIPPLSATPEPRVYYLPKDTAQSVILIGHPSVIAYSPEYNDLDIADDILGAGGFSSRLFTEIRTRRGLAYSTQSGLTQGFSYPGVFFTFAATPAEATGQVIELMLSEIERLQQDGVSDTEVEQSRQRILNSSIFRDVSATAVTQRAARVPLLGLEPGYYERYLENVQTITPDEVQRAAQEQLRPNEAIILVVGNAEMFDRPLSDFGEVVTIDTP